MQTFVILRRSAWNDPGELKVAAERSRRVGDEEMPEEVRWIRSYVVNFPDGKLGTVCIYQGVSADAVREHARRAGMKADEVLPVADTVVVRSDPQPQAASAA